MKVEIKEQLEQEVRELNDILFLTTESLKIVEYLVKSEEDEDKSYTKNMNGFLKYSMIINWRVTVLELMKLLSGRKNDHYGLLRFINKLKPGEKYETAGIDPEAINKWEKRLIDEESAINNLLDQRDKLYAHTDRDCKRIKNSVTVSKAKELLGVAQCVVREIYHRVFQMGFSFDAFNSPVNNLDWIVNSIAGQRKVKMEGSKKLSLKQGILDEFN